MDTVDLIIKSSTEFYNNLKADENGRYRSWEHCYSHFIKARGSKEVDYDYLSLQLAFYLASWGMYRGSAFLLQKEYKVHIPVVKELLNEKYDALAGIDCIGFKDGSLVGEKTIQRLRNNEEYPTTKQTVLGLCYGLKLTIPEAEMLLSKTDFSLKGTSPENNAYRCTLGSCAELSIYEVNEMLEANGYPPFGSSPAE